MDIKAGAAVDRDSHGRGLTVGGSHGPRSDPEALNSLLCVLPAFAEATGWVRRRSGRGRAKLVRGLFAPGQIRPRPRASARPIVAAGRPIFMR